MFSKYFRDLRGCGLEKGKVGEAEFDKAAFMRGIFQIQVFKATDSSYVSKVKHMILNQSGSLKPCIQMSISNY
jgi:hypothetical protein